MRGYLSRVRVRSDGPAMRALLVGGLGRGWSSHAEIWKLFPSTSSERPFLYREFDASGGRSPKAFLVLSTVEPAPGSEVFDVETKPFDPGFAKGLALAFKLKANATTSRRDAQGRQSRHDVVMAAFHDLPAGDGQRAGARKAAVEREGLAWLARQGAKSGFSVVGMPRIEYQAGVVEAATRNRPKDLTMATLDYEGILRVEDPEALKVAIMTGIGRAKAFGCGLLLVRPTA